MQPTVFYRWQKEFFENGAAAFQTKARGNHQAEQERIEYLEKKIQRKDDNHAEGEPGGLIETIEASAEAVFRALPKTTSDRKTPMP